jgi:thiamine pyrophosphate-dependent acetolactate synthase large subunit-like protein
MMSNADLSTVGWFGGAAIGAKLGLDNGKNNSGKFVAAVVGDGTFLFAVPASVYWISRRYNIPFLTIVLNNDGWHAPLRSAKLVHPDGYAAHATNEELNISFRPSPDYVCFYECFVQSTMILTAISIGWNCESGSRWPGLGGNCP